MKITISNNKTKLSNQLTDEYTDTDLSAYFESALLNEKGESVNEGNFMLGIKRIPGKPGFLFNIQPLELVR